MMKIVWTLLFLAVYLYGNEATVTGTWLKAHLHDKDLVLIDVSDKKRYLRGHIPEAGQSSIEKWRQSKGKIASQVQSIKNIEVEMRRLGVNSNSKVVVYFHDLNNKDMLKATYILWAMEYAGFKNSALLDGGIDAFMSVGGVLSNKSAVQRYGKYKAVKNGAVLITINKVKQFINKIPMIDSRPAVYYFGAKKQSILKRAGHISGATSYFWRYSISDKGTIKKMSILTAAFEKGLKLDKTEPLIVYCTGGLEASMNYFVLHRILGFDKAVLYDASMKEWANLDKTSMKMYTWE